MPACMPFFFFLLACDGRDFTCAHAVRQLLIDRPALSVKCMD